MRKKHPSNPQLRKSRLNLNLQRWSRHQNLLSRKKLLKSHQFSLKNKKSSQLKSHLLLYQRKSRNLNYNTKRKSLSHQNSHLRRRCNNQRSKRKLKRKRKVKINKQTPHKCNSLLATPNSIFLHSFCKLRAAISMNRYLALTLT